MSDARTYELVPSSDWLVYETPDLGSERTYINRTQIPLFRVDGLHVRLYLDVRSSISVDLHPPTSAAVNALVGWLVSDSRGRS